MSDLARAIDSVVVAGNCSGCGACALLSSDVEMRQSPAGYLRPSFDPNSLAGQSAHEFNDICPGRVVTARDPSGASYDPIFGTFVSVWKAWANDPALRYSGSSGGTLTALSGWLLGRGDIDRVLMASGSQTEPRLTLPIVATEPQCASRCAGSRYAPTAIASDAAAEDPTAAVVAKPCEISAISRLRTSRGLDSTAPLLSFFCAGTPSQHATDSLVRQLGGDPARLTSLRYRGEGWPGTFHFADGEREGSLPYDESWGRWLGPTMQWRCKICPDGVGESADIVAGDYWEADERGFPVFDTQDGVSVLIARSPLGDALVREAIKAGVIQATPTDVVSLYSIQPHQRERRGTLAARLLGIRLAGGRTPQYRGFGLWRLTLRRHLRRVPRSLIGGLRRYRTLLSQKEDAR